MELAAHSDRTALPASVDDLGERVGERGVALAVLGRAGAGAPGARVRARRDG